MVNTDTNNDIPYYSNSVYCKSDEDCNIKVKINAVKVEKREDTFRYNRRKGWSDVT